MNPNASKSLSTEARNPRSFGLDRMKAHEIVRLMNEEEFIVMRALQNAEAELAVAAQQAARAYQEGGRVVYVGSGTSGRIAVMDAAEMPPTFGIAPERFVAVVSGGAVAAERAVEDAEDDEHAAITAINALSLTRSDVVIGLTASGHTPFVCSALRHARQKGVWTCGIANNRNAEVFEVVDHAILLETGPEVLTGSTRLKAGTAQKLALNRISTAAMVLSGKVIENLMVDVKAKNTKLKDRCARIVSELTGAPTDDARAVLIENGWNVRAAVERLRTPTPN